MRFFKKNKNIILILFLALLLRLVLSFFGTLKLDQGTFIAWSLNLAENGLKHFYRGWSDYLPGYLYILWFLGKARGILPDALLYKLPAILADIVTGFLIYKIVGKIKEKKWALTAAAFYLFNPAILANSALWGQVDSLTALFSLLAIYLMPSAYYLSVIALALGALIKPQAAFIAPLILILMIKEKWQTKKILGYVFLALTVFVLGFVPFNDTGNIFTFIFRRLQATFNQYPYGSVNAFNFWGLFDFWRSDLVTKYLGYGLVAISYFFTAFLAIKKKVNKYALLGLVFLFSFLFLTRMHERHLLPVLAPLAIITALSPSLILPYVGLSLTYAANLFYARQWITYNFMGVFPPWLIKIFIFLNLSLLVFVVISFFKKISLKFFPPLPGFRRASPLFPKIALSVKITKSLLVLIIAFSFFTRVAWLKNPSNEYFDEVYHAFTARLVLHGDPKAWEWWNPHPEGFAYEWTHPPLAKLGMVLGMLVFGENSFGWRIVQAVLGTLAVYLVYKIGKEIFKDELVGILSAVIFSLDGLPLVMSRIGMNDAYLLFFMLLSLYFFLKGKDFWSAISFGLALASKWSAVWVLPVFFVIWLRRKEKFSIYTFLAFGIIPIGIYLLTYTPMFLTGHDLGTWWGMQKQMWWYHTGLRATHPYTSSWWQWPLLLRPIYLYTSDEVGGLVSRIYAMGNPFVFWFGLLSIFLSGLYAYAERNKKLALVVFAYLIFFVPWAASPRIMFLYHYLPSIPFLAIAVGYVLRRNPKLAIGLLGICLLAFIYFYPHFAGLKIPLWLDTSYYWFPSWR